MTSLAEIRDEDSEETEKHLIDLIKAGRPVGFIADTLAWPPDYASKQIRKACRDHGLPRPPKRKQGDMPVGLDEESHTFRAKLGNRLYDLREKMTRGTVQRTIGIPPQSHAKASERPFAFNWNIGQIQRLAKALGMPFKELMLRCLLTEEEFNKVRPWIKL